jgi:tRNA uridine 5-carbamoylmethylation protein Kti12
MYGIFTVHTVMRKGAIMKLILIRGLPGSGKSTIAREYVKQGYHHFEADMYFEKKRSIYI